MNWIVLAKEAAERAATIREELTPLLDDPASAPVESQVVPDSIPQGGLESTYDATILDPDLRAATRSRFVTEHYADAVESGVKALNELVRARTGRTEDGDELMTVVFSANNPLLRVAAGNSKSAQSVQRGHMQLCQGVVAAWRNPRAHENLSDDPARVLVMLATVQELMAVTRQATRTRKRRTKPGP